MYGNVQVVRPEATGKYKKAFHPDSLWIMEEYKAGASGDIAGNEPYDICVIDLKDKSVPGIMPATLGKACNLGTPDFHHPCVACMRPSGSVYSNI